MTIAHSAVAEAATERRLDPVSTRKWSSMGLLTLAVAADNTETSVAKVLFPPLKAALGLTLTDLGVLTAGSKIAGAVFGPMWVWLARRWGRKPVLVIASGGWGVWSIATGFADGFGILFVLYCIFAAGAAGAHVIVNDVLADLFDDARRGRAVGYMYAGLSGFGSIAGPALGQLSGVPDGWRIAFWGIGVANILIGIALMIWFRDPGVGATEIRGSARPNALSSLSVSEALSIFRVPTFNVMLVSRLLSGHLLILSFGVVYLVEVFKFPNSVAALALFPSGIGYLIGATGGGAVVDRLHRMSPDYGRVAFLQCAQILFAVAAYFGTQFDWGSIYVYGAFWFLMGLVQGVNPGVNRPIVMSVISPELRGWAFAVLVAIVESIGWALYTVAAGWFGDHFGLKIVFLVALVWLMLLNGVVLTVLYRTYGADVRRMQSSLQDSDAASAAVLQ